MSEQCSLEQIQEKTGKIIGRDNTAWVFRIVLIALFTVSNGYYWLYADRHNDERYVSKEKHQLIDQENKVRISEMFSVVATLQNQKNGDHDTLVEIKNDLKWVKENLGHYDRDKKTSEK